MVEYGGSSLEESLLEALAVADHIRNTDRAAVESAIAFARQIDLMISQGESSKVLNGPFASYHNVLNNLGLSPEGRHKLEMNETVVEDDF